MSAQHIIQPLFHEGSVGSRCSSTICQTFDRQANESGLYDVDSSWPTEYWVVKKKVAGTCSVDSNEQRVNVQQDEITVREIDGYSKTSLCSTNFDGFTDVNVGARL
ncbi:hypothetical protein T06_13079 [Trichinella sp. T6]|nr:hypothetical protein T06_13079 [Trichinella sp. T6]